MQKRAQQRPDAANGTRLRWEGRRRKLSRTLACLRSPGAGYLTGQNIAMDGGAMLRLPQSRGGDFVAILDAGIYAESDVHGFNGMPKPATVMVRRSEVGLVHAAETPEAMFAEQRMPEWLCGVKEPPARFHEAAGIPHTMASRSR